MKRITIDERWLRVGAWLLVCALILGVAGKVTKYLKENGPEADQKAPTRVLPSVEVKEVEFVTFGADIDSNGEVRPLRRTTVTAEVTGKLVTVVEDFEAGEVFAEGDLLVQIDSADYNAALSAARVAVADANLALQLEESRQAQSLRDWAKLRGGQEPSALVKRLPQMASATAALVAAQSAMEKAQRDVERTSILAPYDCRIERTYVDIGAVVGPGMQLADLVSQGTVDVRFPLSLEDYGYLKRDEEGQVTGAVTVSAQIGGKVRKWEGRLVRSEEIVERSTRSINVVAEFGHNGGEAPPIGMFVKGTIEGVSVPDVVKVPRTAMVNETTVLVLSEKETLAFRAVEVLRSESDVMIVAAGLRAGERIVITPISEPIPGTQVRLLPEEDGGEKKDGEDPPAVTGAEVTSTN